MRQIKFRGQTLNDDIVYGDFVHCVPMSSFNGIVDENGMVHEVSDDNVVQLVGIDSNGKEVYEGDYVEVVHDGKQYVYQAHLEGFATGKDGIYLTSAQLSKARRI